MPEQLTKHPDVTLQVLRSAGAQCGTKAPQEILKACPAERFCKLPGGEICVYGIADAPKMTQFSAADWQALAAAARVPGVAAPPPKTGSGTGGGAFDPLLAMASALALVLLGAAFGWKLRRPP
ncbi:hypothetical protein [Piscinibacter sp. XHJ-5]|uniref:hypothetical protein n=1 Tax=Piscinibacter sp. XHJ-5 TaxID=3037797 RepID=UPI0024534275|nr:hypothetical protein [Piscinibacter sp. XHJ-5]